MNGLARTVSVFQAVDRPTLKVDDFTVGQVLEFIRAGRYAEGVTAVRRAAPEHRKGAKKRLPVVTFSGVFRRRDRAGLLEHSALVVLDRDHLPDVEAAKAEAARSPHTVAAFGSPSGDGLKIIACVICTDAETGEERLPRDDAEHKQAYAAVVATYELDSLDEAADVCRACFVSHDPGLYSNPNAEPVAVTLRRPEQRQQRVPASSDELPDPALIASALNALEDRPPYDDGELVNGYRRPGWASLVSAVLHGCGGDEDLAERLLSQRWPEEVKGEYREKFKHPLARRHVGTLFKCAQRCGWDRKKAALTVAAEGGEVPEPEEEKQARESAASCIVRLVRALIDRGLAELWHDAEGTAYVTFDAAGHAETARLRHKVARSWLARLYYDQRGRAPGSQALEDAVQVLEGIARYDGAEHRTAVRVAEVDTDAGPTVYLDLGGPTWEVVEARAGHWDVIPASACPVRFERRSGLLPLPVPQRGGNAQKLGDLLNIDTLSLLLALAWLVQALRGRGPYPILEVNGEQGSGKSTAARILRSIIDPNVAALRSVPRSDHEAFISASNAHILALDNVSGFGREVSDRMCRIATGGGLSVRELYTTDEERLFDVARPQIVNGIEGLANQPDLADRTIVLLLPRIDEEDRRTEAELYAALAAAWPGILGGLLDAVAEGLQRLPRIQLDRLPRMADFALWATACEVPLGYQEGDFMRAYEEGRAALIEATIEGECIAEAVLKLAAEQAAEVDAKLFSGTAAELLDALVTTMKYGSGPNERRPPREWPKNARALSGKLRRLAPSLRALGVAVELDKHEGRGRDRRRVLTIEKLTTDSRPYRPLRLHSTEDRPEQAGNGEMVWGRKTGASGLFASPPDAFASPRNGLNGVQSQNGDGADGGDAKSALYSEGDGVPDALAVNPIYPEAPF